jgi:hypothetical protein
VAIADINDRLRNGHRLLSKNGNIDITVRPRRSASDRPEYDRKIDIGLSCKQVSQRSKRGVNVGGHG